MLTDEGASGPSSPSLQPLATQPPRPSGRFISVGGSVPEAIDPPSAPVPSQQVGILIARSGIAVPSRLLERHAQAMNALLGQGASPCGLQSAVQEAADALAQVHQAFVSALPAGAAAASPAYQEVSSALMGEARLINAISHNGEVPARPEHFLDLAAELPPSCLDLMPLRQPKAASDAR